ncbi:hypothetical protein [Prevotella sp. tf2-5]|uniref:hypothetical protein n=1 Tax=Prevotella sp. tf2-5 TaxID=1761889 RepID=UPI0011602F40|nr:hypothetical protein [Prevotella sp. tf2-5]
MLRQLSLFFALLLLPMGVWGQTDYGLTVAGVNVTSANASNITGQYLTEGTAVFDANSNTLTLTNVAIGYGGVQSGLENLTIIFNGTNMIESYIGANADVAGTHNLTLQSGTEGSTMYLDNTVGKSIIDGFDNVSMDGLYVSSETPYAYNATAKQFKGVQFSGVILQNATITSTPHYSLWVGYTQLSDENKTDLFPNDQSLAGKVSFDNTSNTLSLQNADLTYYNVFSVLSDLTIDVSGYCSVGAGDSATAVRNVHPSGVLTLKSTGSGNQLTFNNNRPIRDFSSLTLTGLYWDGDYTYGPATIEDWDAEKQESVQLVGKHLLKKDGSEAAGAIAFSDLPRPSMYASSNQQNEPTFGFEGDPSWEIRYSIDYVDESLADVTNALYDMQGDNVPLQGAATVTAWTVFGDATSDVVKGKLFDLSETSLSTVYGTAETLSAPTLRPAIDPEDKITVSYLGREQSDVATINASTGEVTILGPGSETFNVGFTLDDGCTVLNYEYLTFDVTVQKSYSLFIGDTQVTEANADDVLGDGKVSFTVSGGQEAAPTYTLTLNGAALTAPVKVGLANLTFDIRGNNTITTNTTCIQNTATTGVPSLTFKSNADVVGSLTLTNNSDETDDGVISSSFYSNNTSYYTISKELALIILRNGEYTFNTYYFTAGEVHNVQFVPSYGVQIGETQIYEGNAADVFGDGTVSFDKTKNILTLNGASLSGPLSTSLATLTVDLIGENTLRNYYDGHVIETPYGDDVTITFKSSADVKGMLTMTMNYSQDGNMASEHVTMEYTSPLSVISGSMTGNVGNKSVVIGVNYGITITTAGGSYPVTSDNRLDVLGDGGSVQFDGKNTLILNNAWISSVILGADDSWVKKGLTIYLKGDNTIGEQEQDGLIYQGQGANVSLTFATGDVEPGTLTLSYSDQPLVGFTPTYLNNLTDMMNPDLHQITIAVSMEPFVTQSEKEKTEDGNGIGLGKDLEQVVQGLSAEAATTLLGEGVIVNKILYTLPNNDDGYIDDPDYVAVNGKVVALNTPMDDGEVNDILEYIKNGLIQPGTKLGDPYTFAYYFHGMSFLLPAGSGDIILDVNTNEAGELHVKVGNNDPVVISATTGFEERRVPYALTEASYVFIYNVTSAPSSSRRSAGHRAPGRKETTTVGIKGLSVSASDVSPAPGPALSPKKLDKSLLVKEGNHITVKDMDVEDIEVDAFDELSGDITYVDLRQTSIKGMSVNRMISDDLFKKLPEKTFIYLPAGNEVITGTKNVVVGSVCNDMELDAAAPFEASKDFVAVKAVHARDFSTMLDKHCTVYLPFALDEEQASSLGTFYEMTGIADGKIMFTSVKETKANMPYMFKPAKETVSAKMVEVKATIPGAPVVGSATFEGTYDQKSILSDASTQYYCFKAEDGILVHVIDNSMTVDPFRCYIKVTGGASLGRFLDIVVDDETTAVKNIKVGSEDNVYYDLSGRRVLYPKKGMYIMNGKKVIIK